MLLAHKIRLSPNRTQANYFARAAGVTRFTYNWALEEWGKQYDAGGKPSAFGLKKQFNSIKQEQFPFVCEVTKSAAEKAFADLGVAFSSFFRRVKSGKKGHEVGYPKFKSKKKSRPSFYLGNDQFKLDGKKVRIPKLGWVRMREVLRFDGKIKGARIGRDGNCWHISIQVEIDDPQVDATKSSQPTIGIDLGISKLMTLSDGRVVENQRYTIKHQKRLRKLNKKLSRQVKGSRNWWKTVYKIRQLHARIRNLRQDYLHKTTSQLSAESSIIVIEDLHAKGMIQNHKLAKHLADVAFGEIARQFTYKQKIYGSRLIKIDRWFASSKTCSCCGHVQQMCLSDRVFVCEKCGMVKDRDLNASLNIEHEGLRMIGLRLA